MQKRTFFRSLVGLLSVALLATSCSDEDTLVESSQPTELQLTVQSYPQNTRAVVRTSTLPPGSKLLLSLKGKDLTQYDGQYNTERLYTGVGTGDGQIWSPDDTPILLSSTRGYLYAFYPGDLSSTYAINSKLVDASTQTDYMYAVPVEGISNSNPRATLVMKHALSVIRLNIKKGTYTGTGYLTCAAVAGESMALKARLDATTGLLSSFSGIGMSQSVEPNFNLYSSAQSVDVIVVPTGEEKPLTFTLVVDGQAYSASTAPVILEQGKIYNYDITMDDLEASVSKVTAMLWQSEDKESLTPGIPEEVRANAGDYVYADGTVSPELDESKALVGYCIGPWGGFIGFNDSSFANQIQGYYTKNVILSVSDLHKSMPYFSSSSINLSSVNTYRACAWNDTWLMKLVKGHEKEILPYDYCRNRMELCGGWKMPSYMQMMAWWVLSPALPKKFKMSYYFYCLTSWVNKDEVDMIDPQGGRMACKSPLNSYLVCPVMEVEPRTEDGLGAKILVENDQIIIDLSGLDALGFTTTENNRVQGTPSTTAYLNGTMSVGATLTGNNYYDYDHPYCPSYEYGKIKDEYYTANGNPYSSGGGHGGGAWSARVSRRFAILKHDLNDGATYTWVDAYNAAQNFSGEGGAKGAWRLPTEREMMVLALLMPQLRRLGGSVFENFDGGDYWTSTERENTGFAWYFDSDVPSMKSDIKTYKCRVRPIRDCN